MLWTLSNLHLSFIFKEYGGTSLVLQCKLRLCSQCRGHGFNPWLGNWHLHATWCGQKNNKQYGNITQLSYRDSCTICIFCPNGFKCAPKPSCKLNEKWNCSFAFFLFLRQVETPPRGEYILKKLSVVYHSSYDTLISYYYTFLVSFLWL